MQVTYGDLISLQTKTNRPVGYSPSQITGVMQFASNDNAEPGDTPKLFALDYAGLDASASPTTARGNPVLYGDKVYFSYSDQDISSDPCEFFTLSYQAGTGKWIVGGHESNPVHAKIADSSRYVNSRQWVVTPIGKSANTPIGNIVRYGDEFALYNFAEEHLTVTLTSDDSQFELWYDTDAKGGFTPDQITIFSFTNNIGQVPTEPSSPTCTGPITCTGPGCVATPTAITPCQPYYTPKAVNSSNCSFTCTPNTIAGQGGTTSTTCSSYPTPGSCNDKQCDDAGNCGAQYNCTTPKCVDGKYDCTQCDSSSSNWKTVLAIVLAALLIAGVVGFFFLRS